MANDKMTPEAVANLESYRRRKDAERADKIDTRFFNMNRSRIFHIRPSLPTEAVPTVEGLPVNNACLMMIDRQQKNVERHWMPLNLLSVPDEEQFLGWLWVKWKLAKTEGNDLDISVSEHKQALVETGNWKEPVDG
ncbi:hypothetical protein EPK99_24990 [Neorhizobium lilium]|uniref:Uncharacterized protein n=1 Tax=Neorhizobium lilium TaxID=2503024 RepID=A0A3S3S981_9HYPH|nr:hypothetical protein [Neorhizobium lilium]RWX74443.1 hypothetical protein EPK99_24990 [Neorhizobium lilium]